VLLVGLAVLAQPAVTALPAAASPVDRKKPAAPVELVTSRPDAVSAMVTARAQGSRVEIEAARTEYSTSFANPDATTTIETSAGQIRYRDAKGVLRDVDLALQVAPDGTVRAKGHPNGLRLSGKTNGATEDLVTASAGTGREVAFGWSGKLPAPVIDGTTATFRSVTPGVDLVVESLRSGFAQSFVIHDRPTGPLSWELPLRTKGLTARAEADGSISFLNAKGKLASRIPPAIAWDAAVDPNTGEHTSTSPVALSVRQNGKGKAVLTITADQAWASDPARVLPLTIDPDAAVELDPNFDAFVQEGVTTDQSASTELKLGNNGSGQRARSFIKFGTGTTSQISGRLVTAATLKLWETHSWSCSTREWQVRETDAAGSATRWTDQPAWGPVAAATWQTKGYSSSCADGQVTQNITDLVAGWNDGAAHTIGIRATDESDPYGWKKFDSSEGSHPPVIAVTYDRAPNAPAAPTVSGALTYTPPGGTAGLYINSTGPRLSSNPMSDPDGNIMSAVFEVRTASGNTLVGSCPDNHVDNNGEGFCYLSGFPASGGPYNLQVQATDPKGLKSSWSVRSNVYAATSPPAAPSNLSCGSYAQGSWTTQVPAAPVGCTASVSGSGGQAPKAIHYRVDGGDWVVVAAQTATTVTANQISVPNTSGAHQILAFSEGPGGALSNSVTYSFGYGTVGLSAPKRGELTTTAGPVRVTVTGPAVIGTGTPTASMRWRMAGETDPAVGWQPVSGVSFAQSTSGATRSATALWDAAGAVKAATGTDRVPTRVEVQACLTYPGTAEQCTATAANSTGPVPVQYVPHAFGNGFPVAEAGPGQVALWTGEFQTDATDVAVPGYTGSLSISRTHSTYAGDPTPAQGVFGPGWIASLDGPDAGISGWSVIDHTWLDGTLILLDSEGTPLIYNTPGGARRAGANLPQTVAGTSEYTPADDDTALAGARIVVTGTGAATTVQFIEDSGVVTTFAVTAAPVTGASASFVPDRVTEPGVAGATAFSRDSAGRVTRIIAPAPPGVNCTPSPTDPNAALLVKGCRSLRITYANGLAQSVFLDIWDPAAGGGAGAATSTEVAHYAYVNGRLASVTDPRSNLSTGYSYVGSDPRPRLASLTPPGLTPYQFSYADRDGTQVLATVTRARPAGDPAGGTATLASYVYGVPTSGTNLPDLSAGAVAAWNQNAAPTYGAAVFGPDHPVSGIDPSGKSGDWHYASLVYTDALGYTVNNAEFGAGAWQLSATDYDSHGNVIHSYDPTAIATIQAASVPNGLSALQLAAVTVYNDDIPNASGQIVTPAGTLVTETFGAARRALVSDGTAAGGSGPCPGGECMAWVRPHTRYSYDQGAPHAGINPATQLPYRLLTTTKVTVENPADGTDLETLSVVRTGYDAIQAGDTPGWDLGLATTSTTDMGSGADIVDTARYDSEGRIIQTRQPASTSGTGAGTRDLSYYTAGANPVSACGGHAEWAGLVCQTAPGDGSGSVLPTTRTLGYSALLAPTLVEETSGTTARTTYLSYLPDGRARDAATEVTGLGNSEPVPATRIVYDAATGLPIQLVQITGFGGTATTVAETTVYDSWGRTTSYTPSGGDGATTTVYDASGRVSSVTDSAGSTTTWSYDGDGTNGTDALGKIEHRGLPTQLTVSNPTGPAITVTGAYDAFGNLLTQTLPGGISQTVSYDTVGQPTGLTYSGQVGNDPDIAWLGWAQTRDAAGRVRQEWTPAGAAFTTAGTGAAKAYDRRYSYDRAGRLLTVNDRTNAATGALLDPDSPATLTAACQTRTYTFDVNGNRTGADRWNANADGSCATPGTPTASWDYNAADQLTSGADGQGSYAYDKLGRATTIPAIDTPRGASAGNLTIGYYETDAVHILAQDGTTTTYSLDVAGRRQAAETVTGSATTTLERHYTDTSDNPGWVVETSGGNATTTRYAATLGGTVPIEITDGNVTLRLSNPHGDTVTTVLVPGTGPATAITAWSDYDEYGTPRSPGSTAAVDGSGHYAWLGGNERATDTSGLLLMGVRLYNPTTAQFTSIDPVVGGNETAYSYPGDPVNQYDLTGACITCWIKDHRTELLMVAAVVTAPVPVVGEVVAYTAAVSAIADAGQNVREGHYKAAAGDLLGAGTAGAGGALLHGTRKVKKLEKLAKEGSRLKGTLKRRHQRRVYQGSVLSTTGMGKGGILQKQKPPPPMAGHNANGGRSLAGGSVPW
jgi:RHS repeat-associated protein